METCTGCGRRAFEGRCHVCGWMSPEGGRAARSRRRVEWLGGLLLLALTAMIPFIAALAWPILSIAIYRGLERRFGARHRDEYLGILKKGALLALAGTIAGSATFLCCLPVILAVAASPR